MPTWTPSPASTTTGTSTRRWRARSRGRSATIGSSPSSSSTSTTSRPSNDRIGHLAGRLGARRSGGARHGASSAVPTSPAVSVATSSRSSSRSRRRGRRELYRRLQFAVGSEPLAVGPSSSASPPESPSSSPEDDAVVVLQARRRGALRGEGARQGPGDRRRRARAPRMSARAGRRLAMRAEADGARGLLAAPDERAHVLEEAPAVGLQPCERKWPGRVASRLLERQAARSRSPGPVTFLPTSLWILWITRRGARPPRLLERPLRLRPSQSTPRRRPPPIPLFEGCPSKSSQRARKSRAGTFARAIARQRPSYSSTSPCSSTTSSAVKSLVRVAVAVLSPSRVVALHALARRGARGQPQPGDGDLAPSPRLPARRRRIGQRVRRRREAEITSTQSVNSGGAPAGPQVAELDRLARSPLGNATSTSTSRVAQARVDRHGIAHLDRLLRPCVKTVPRELQPAPCSRRARRARCPPPPISPRIAATTRPA